MSTTDLKQYATSSHDFYALLGVDISTSESDIHRAYRKTALKYHPDKLGKDFDPEKFHLLQIANDVLSDPAAKAAYDNARNAREQKKRQNELFEGKRRQMKEDLEMRERGVKRGREEEESAEVALEREVRRLAEDGKRRRREMEERLRAEAEAGVSIPSMATTSHAPTSTATKPPVSTPAEADDEIAILERKIAEAKALKAKQRAEKKARKSGVFPTSSTDETPRKGGTTAEESKWNNDTSEGRVASSSSTPIQRRPDLFKGLNKSSASSSSASPKFSFSPRVEGKTDFAATMARLKEAERKRLEEEIRRRERETV